MINRCCTDPITIKNIEFTEGSIIAVDVLSVHYDKELWGPEDTTKFYPARHAPECKRKAAAYLAFGYGPKSKNKMT